MKTLWLFVFAAAFALKLQAQNLSTISNISEDKIFTHDIDVMPEYSGGMKRFYNRIKRIPYTFDDRMNARKGLVTVFMVVEKDGSLSNLKIIHGISDVQNKEIMRVVKKLQPWKPGIHQGQPVRVLYSVPINFELVDKLDPI